MSNKEVKMYCPICRNPLMKSDHRKFETLCDHVGDPNIPINERPDRPTWQCKHKKCSLYNNGFWDYDGSYYTRQVHKEYEELEKEAFQNNLSALNSFERKISIEIYKHDDDKYFNFHFFKIKLEYKYTADEWGEILKKRIKPRLLIKDGQFYIYHVSGIKMLFFILKEFYNKKKKIINFSEKYHSYTIKNIQDDLEKDSWDKRWWRIVGIFIIKLFNHRFLKECGII